MFTFEELEKEVRRLSDENPEFVYKGEEGFFSPHCSYLTGKNDPPVGCIFGQALTALLPDTTILEEADANKLTITAVLRVAGVDLSETQRRWAGEVQEYQDSGIQWKEAVVMADEFIREYREE
jgi:hypothetical protein